MNDNTERDPRLLAIPDTHGHAKGEHKPFAEERPLPLTARMLFLWFYHACRRGYPRFLMVADHMNYLTFEDPAAVNLVRRALKLAQAGDLYGAAETANVDVAHAAVVGEGLRRGMRYSIGAEVDNDPRSRPDAQNIVDAMRPDAILRSVHFVPITHPVHGENWPWPFDNPEFSEHLETVGAAQLWELYMSALLDAIERLPGHIVGHFYVPTVIGAWPDEKKLEEYEDKMLAAVAERGMAIEFNTRFLYRDHSDEEKRRYLQANRRLLRKAKQRGIGIAIGSDAHSPKDQGAGFETVLRILDELEINEIIFPIAGRLLRVALKVVREPEPEPPPPPEPPKAEKPPETEAPVRKARPSATPTRARATTAERKPERPQPAAAEPALPAPPPEKALPEHAGTTRKGAKKPEPKAPPKPVAKPAPKPAAKPPAAKTAAAKPAPKPAPKPVAKPAAAAKPAANAKAKPAAKNVVAKKTAPAKKAAPARAAAAKKPVAKKPAAKKAAPAKAPAKKNAVKKAAAKRPVAKKAPARSAPARKPAAKKSGAKKRR